MNCPSMTIKCPPMTIKCPAMTIKCPPMTIKCPAMEQELETVSKITLNHVHKPAASWSQTIFSPQIMSVRNVECAVGWDNMRSRVG